MWTEVTCDVLDAGFVGPRPHLRLRREIRYKRGEHLQSNHKHKSMSLASSPSPHHRHPRLLSSSGSCQRPQNYWRQQNGQYDRRGNAIRRTWTKPPPPTPTKWLAKFTRQTLSLY